MRLCCKADVRYFVSGTHDISFWLKTNEDGHSGAGFKIHFSAIRTLAAYNACSASEEFACDGDK